MLLNPVADYGTLTVVDVEADSEARADSAAYDGGYVDRSSVRQREGDMDRLTDRQRHRGVELHAANGKIAAFGRHAVNSTVAPNRDRNFKRDAGRAPGFAAELKLSFCRNPLLWSGTATKECDEENASNNSGRN